MAAARLGTAAMADDLNFDFEAQLNARDAVDREVTKVRARARGCQRLLCGRGVPRLPPPDARARASDVGARAVVRLRVLCCTARAVAAQPRRCGAGFREGERRSAAAAAARAASAPPRAQARARAARARRER